MPLLPGSHPDIISHNIHEMIASGHPHNQAVAAALHNAGVKRSKRAKKILDHHNAMSMGTGAPVAPGEGSGTVGGY